MTSSTILTRAGLAKSPSGQWLSQRWTIALTQRSHPAEAALAGLDEIAAGDCAADNVIDRARASLQARIGPSRARIGGTQAIEPDGLTGRELRRGLNAAEAAELARLDDDGTIGQPTRQPLHRGLDLAATRGGATCDAYTDPRSGAEQVVDDESSADSCCGARGPRWLAA